MSFYEKNTTIVEPYLKAAPDTKTASKAMESTRNVMGAVASIVIVAACLYAMIDESVVWLLYGFCAAAPIAGYAVALHLWSKATAINEAILSELKQRSQ